jgi:hypothetical protein
LVKWLRKELVTKGLRIDHPFLLSLAQYADETRAVDSIVESSKTEVCEFAHEVHVFHGERCRAIQEGLEKIPDRKDIDLEQLIWALCGYYRDVEQVGIS